MQPASPLIEKLELSIEKKKELLQTNYFKYAMRAVLACLFLTIGTGVAFVAGMKCDSLIHGSGKFMYAFVFSWSLVMILYMNTELGTSNMLYAAVGLYRKKLTASQATKLLISCLLFNLIGGLIFGFLIAQTGPFQQLAPENFITEIVSSKLLKPAGQIIIEGMFANILVNTAVLISLKMSDDAGKIAAILALISMFAFMGFEHVIANFPAFTIALTITHGSLAAMSLTSLLHNLLFALLGNFIGGGLIIGLSYAWLNNTSVRYKD